jgi:hypothetical protein
MRTNASVKFMTLKTARDERKRRPRSARGNRGPALGRVSRVTQRERIKLWQPDSKISFRDNIRVRSNTPITEEHGLAGLSERTYVASTNTVRSQAVEVICASPRQLMQSMSSSKVSRSS